MYPHRELIRLGVHKGILRRRIARQRLQCGEAAAQLVRPIAWLDRALALWRRMPPLAQVAIPSVGAMAARLLFPRHKLLNGLMRWGPIVAGAVRGVRSMAGPRH